MSTDVKMQELELETAELLPSRETMCCYGSRVTQVELVNINNSFNNILNNYGILGF
jgi:hypothetical protein